MMSKKLALIAGVCVVIAATFGVVGITRNNLNNQVPPSQTEAAISDDDQVEENDAQGVDSDGEDSSNEQDTPIDDQATSEATEADSDHDEADDAEVAKNIVSTDFHIHSVTDSEGNEFAPRVVFGAEYYDCYIRFDDAGKFELYLDTATGATQSGTYIINEDTIQVNYEGDRSASYQITYDDNGQLNSIIVPYGEYNVVFGS